jgi:hypothetical protein
LAHKKKDNFTPFAQPFAQCDAQLRTSTAAEKKLGSSFSTHGKQVQQENSVLKRRFQEGEQQMAAGACPYQYRACPFSQSQGFHRTALGSEQATSKA